MVYNSESQLRHPRRVILGLLHDLSISHHLGWQLMLRDLRAQYRQSFLGIAWAFLPPLVLALTFGLASESKVLNIGHTDLPYPAYIMLSVVLWQTFVEALTGPLAGITEYKLMLARINFPREAIIFSKLAQVFFNFGIKLLLLVAVFIWFRIPLAGTAILAPFALLALIILGTAIGLLLAPFGGLFQDVSKGLTVLTGLWMLLTPVVYPVPQNGLLARLILLNPVTPLLVSVRELATSGSLSQPLAFAGVAFSSVILLAIAAVIFRLAMPFVIERVGT